MGIVISTYISSYYHPTQTVIAAASMTLMETTRNILIAILTIVTVTVGAVMFTNANRAHARFVCPSDTYTVHAGDTLSGIVIAHCEGNLENAIYQTVKMNGGALIHPGQTIAFPTGA
jgi:hypothetical protein